MNAVNALLPAFLAAFSVQRIIEIADSLVPDSWHKAAVPKKIVLAFITIGVGVALAHYGTIRVVGPLCSSVSSSAQSKSDAGQPKTTTSSGSAAGSTNDSTAAGDKSGSAGEHSTPACPKLPDSVDFFITVMVISGGTEAVNSILKFLNYKKEETKASAAKTTNATKSEPGGTQALTEMANK